MSRRPGGLLPLAAFVLADVAFAFQQTAIAPAIPTVQHDLHASREWSAWLLTGYLVAASVATPLIGKLGDRTGRRRALVGALLGYAAASVGAALAPGIVALILFRSLQGVGGVVFPLTLSLARDVLPEERVGLGVGLLTGAFGLGTSLGFGISGLIVDALSWRYLFAVGAAFVLAATVGVLRVPAPDEQTEPGRVDLPGVLLLGGGLALLLIGITEGTGRGFGSGVVIGLLALAVCLLAGWVVVDSRVEDPLIDLRVVARRDVLLTNLATIPLGYVLFGAYFLVPYLVRGASVETTGLYLLPSALGQTATGPLAGRLARRVAPKWPFGAGMILVALAGGSLAAWHDGAVEIVAATAALGAGAGLAISVASTLATERVAASESGVAAALNSTVRRAGGGVGAQLDALLLATAGAAFAWAFGISALLAAAGAVLALALRRR